MFKYFTMVYNLKLLTLSALLYEVFIKSVTNELYTWAVYGLKHTLKLNWQGFASSSTPHDIQTVERIIKIWIFLRVHFFFFYF